MKRNQGYAFILIPLLYKSCFISAQQIEQEYASCGDCPCINGGETCPYDIVPEEITYQNLAFYQSLELTNPYNLDCDPYKDPACDTTPSQILTELGDTAVCAVKYDMTSLNDGQCPAKYSLGTYASKEEADANGAYLTHWGSCGVCSTLQDFAAYVIHVDLTEKGTECSLRGFLNPADAITCYMEVGFTEPCAEMWLHNGFQTRSSCLFVCTSFRVQGRPSNGNPTECTLDPCLQCDEDNSGPKFAKVAARTRRRSGLLSMIVRPCDDILSVEHRVPCDVSNYTFVPTPSEPDCSAFDLISGGDTSSAIQCSLPYGCIDSAQTFCGTLSYSFNLFRENGTYTFETCMTDITIPVFDSYCASFKGENVSLPPSECDVAINDNPGCTCELISCDGAGQGFLLGCGVNFLGQSAGATLNTCNGELGTSLTSAATTPLLTLGADQHSRTISWLIVASLAGLSLTYIL